MEKKVRAHYVAYDNFRKKEEALEADRKEIQELKALAEKIKKKTN